MRISWLIGLMAILLATAWIAAPQAAAPHAGEHGAEHLIFRPGALEWQDGPGALPPGAQYVIFEGDPSVAGEYFAWRIKLPDGYRIPPHWHPVHERVTVLSGTFHLGTGETFDAAATEALGAGSFFVMPPEMRHFAFAEGETVIQLNSIGPFEIHYVDPEDDPRG